jgi:hypothetical protein
MGAPTPDESGQAAGGRITAPVEDRAAAATGQPREVVQLSKGDGPGARAAQERIRSLEEELAARQKTINDWPTVSPGWKSRSRTFRP